MVNKSIKSYKPDEGQTIWQLIPYAIASGKTQMAMDELLLNQYAAATQPVSSLRFYGWQPKAISLGYHQRHIPNHWHQLAIEKGLDLVRRPSGGRAVLHGDDLTYAVVTGVGDRSRSEMYRYICQFLVAGLAQLGINLSYGQAKTGYVYNPSCFATATTADLVTEQGLKLIGSAQVYRRGLVHTAVLQHGSIQISSDHPLLERLFGQPQPITSLSELSHPKTTIPALIDILIGTAISNFGISQFHSPIAPPE